jgi:divalent metal cation (Fe/Co/Zn/Cd) transporter
VDEIRHAASDARGIEDVSDVRVRWIGHWLHAEVNLSVSPELSITDAHELAREARHEILHHLPYLSNAVIHVDPVHESGEAFHRIEKHVHDDFEPHFHP